MKGFKDSTKMKSGHGGEKVAKEHWSVPIARKALGGSIVAPMGGGPKIGGGGLGAGRPIMPRPRVMPNVAKPKGLGIAKLAKGGRFHGNLQEVGPYSDNEVKHPTPPARPGYKDGGAVCDESSVRKIADQEVGKHVAAPKPRGHGLKSGKGFSREPFCGGGRS